MKKSEYNAMKRELEGARNEAVEAAEARFAEAVEALDRLWEVAGDGGTSRRPGRKKITRKKATRKKTARRKITKKKRRGRPAKKVSKKRTTRKKTARKTSGRGRRPRGALIESMRGAIKPLSGRFTIAEVKDGLQHQGVSLNNINPAVLSTTMKRLEDLGEIKLVERGRGRRASIFKKG